MKDTWKQAIFRTRYQESQEYFTISGQQEIKKRENWSFSTYCTCTYLMFLFIIFCTLSCVLLCICEQVSTLFHGCMYSCCVIIAVLCACLLYYCAIGLDCYVFVNVLSCYICTCFILARISPLSEFLCFLLFV